MLPLKRSLVTGVFSILALLGSAALAACGGAAPAAPAAPPPAPLTVKATEFSFNGPQQIEAGLVSFTLKNAGTKLHNGVFQRLRNGVSLTEYKAALARGGIGEAFAEIDYFGGSNVVPPGRSQTVVLDLQEGQYVLVSTTASQDGVRDITKGMLAPIKVVSRTSPAASEPQAGITVGLKDAVAIPLPPTISAGTHILKITSNGTVPHHLLIVKPLPGKTAADVLAWFKSKRTAAVPFSGVGGTNALSPGKRVWFTVELTPGEYVALEDFPNPPATHTLPAHFTVTG